MAGITLEKGKAIYTYGQPMNALHLIASGKVRVDYPGGSYLLGKGDIIGICEICSEIHFLNYTVAEDVTLATYSLLNTKMLGDLLQQRTDVAKYFMLSACRQVNILQNRCALLAVDCSTLYRSLMEDAEKYNTLCSRYRILARKPEGLEELTAFLEEESDDLLQNGFYLGLSHIYAGEHSRDFLKEDSVSLGLLRRAATDYQRIWDDISEQFKYLQQIAGFYFEATGNDLFTCYTTLYQKLDPHSEERESLLTDINRMTAQCKKYITVPQEEIGKRIQTFKDSLSAAAIPAEEKEADSALPSELVNSLDTILEFAGEHLGIADSFRKHILLYRKVDDKNSTDREVCALRRDLTDEFYVLYTTLFEQTLHQKKIPAPVMMFLYFGYADEELAGTANAITLYQLASKIRDTSDLGLYTFYDWLLAIFQGKKEPSRNEFDQDYTDYIHKQKVSGLITDIEIMALEKNGMSKVNFELKNMFPTVNKITFGRIAAFCPIFIAEHALRDLQSSYVTVSKLAKAIEQVRHVDFSAFYRTGLDMDHMDAMGKTPIHTEYLPDVILLPNAGIRGVMWQEIEGKRRNTPSRMMFSIFHMEDATTSFLRMTAEFRWELCKRVQGGRWNDISEPSLTSEYFDYIQFYRKNHDLSNEAKERIRTGLMQTKNSFKEMFVRDYMTWILFEGNASPRLNKVARKILFTYCPFSREVCDILEQNPLYGELLQRYKIKKAQQLHQLNMLKQKLRNSNLPLPDTLERECEFYEL